MAINAYTGLMGSGKTFEVVQNVILPALLAGRRVVTNVAGLQLLDIYAYVIEKHGADASKLGSIVQVSNEQVALPNFFPVEVKSGDVAPASIVLGGDLVVIDECWRWWATGCKVTLEHMTFFRMHRHFVNDVTLSTCDIVLVVQDIGDLDRKIKVVVENTFRMSKLKALGAPKRYRVDVYGGYKLSASTPKIREIQRSYDPEIFKLYSSYSQGAAGGKEGVIDKRATIWGGAFFSLVLPALVVVAGLAYWSLTGFFHQKEKKAAVSGAATTATKEGDSPGAVSKIVSDPPVLSDWRVRGHFSSNGRHVVVFSRDGALRMLVDPIGFSYDGSHVSGFLDGRVVTEYTGSDSASESSSILKAGALK